MLTNPQPTRPYCLLPLHWRPNFNSVLNVKAPVGAFNQEKALVGAFPVIVKPMDRFAVLIYIIHAWETGDC